MLRVVLTTWKATRTPDWCQASLNLRSNSAFARTCRVWTSAWLSDCAERSRAVSEQSEPPKQEPGRHAKRDAETYIVLGAFVTLISIPVLIGTFFAERPHAQVVNAVAGLVLLGVGVGIGVWGVIARKKITP